MNIDSKLLGDLICQTASTVGTGVLIANFTVGAGGPAVLAAITQAPEVKVVQSMQQVPPAKPMSPANKLKPKKKKSAKRLKQN